MARVSVADAARRLSVSERRVQQRIADGSLPAERIGERWAIEERDLLPLLSQRHAGRPLSERSAWAVIAASFMLMDAADARGAEAAAQWLADLAPSERIRARSRLQDLLLRAANADADIDLAQMAEKLRILLGNRAGRVELRASPRDLADVRQDEHVALAGLSSPKAGIASGDLVEGYIDAASFDAVVENYLLERGQRDEDANVILHVVPDDLARRAPELWRAAAAMLPLLLAADLAEHRRPREHARAAGLLADLSNRILGP